MMLNVFPPHGNTEGSLPLLLSKHKGHPGPTDLAQERDAEVQAGQEQHAEL